MKKISSEKDVIISVKSSQTAGGETDDIVELVTAGRLRATGEGYTLSYMESELTGLDGTLTTFEILPKAVTLTRQGKVNSQMVFEEGKHYYFLYDTPFGSATMGVNTRSIRKAFDENGGSLDISYAVDIENIFMGDNSFQINVREAGHSQAESAQ